MIKIDIKYLENKISEFEIKGHANSVENNSENDLVCAGVSAIVYGILNSLKDEYLDIKISDGYVLIKVKEYLKENNFILEILKKSLLTIEEDNKKFIKIKER